MLICINRLRVPRSPFPVPRSPFPVPRSPDKPLKNGRKDVDSGFVHVHDIMDTVNGERYFVRAHVWPSMKTELPHNVIVVISVNSGAVLHASCEPCRASSLGRCSHVVAVLFSVLDYVEKHRPVFC